MTLVRLIVVLAALVLGVLIVRAFGLADFFEAFARIGADPWGLVSLVDLYLGFVLLAVIIATVETRLAAIAWIVGLFVLGNLLGALWFAWRLPMLHARLSRSDGTRDGA